MIIDRILDRKFGEPYDAKGFYEYCNEEEQFFNLGTHIAETMDNGTNEQVQAELCRYIINCEYNPEICDYIKSVEWI